MAEVANRAGSLGLSADALSRLQLIVEELFINTISHGHRGDSDDRVLIRLLPATDGITLHYEDGAPPFDPTRPLAQTIDPEVPGGLGLSLIRGMSKSQRYRHQNGRNITELDI